MDFFDFCSYHGSGEVDTDVNSASGDTFVLDALLVDHFTSTPLFDAIQHNDWGGVDIFLETGSFTFSPFQSDSERRSAAAAAEDQAETWVVCRDEKGKLLWRLLPIHAAICFGAPLKTVKELIRVYPDALCCADTEGNLPLHLAIKFNRHEAILLVLLKAFPEALHAENGKGQLPLELSSHLHDEAASARFRLFQTFIDCTKIDTKKELHQKQSEIQSLIRYRKRVKTELAQAKKELQEAKQDLHTMQMPTTSKFSRLGVAERIRSWKSKRTASFVCHKVDAITNEHKL